MDQSAAHMTEKTEKPENDENYKYSPQHRFYFRLISSQGLCATPQQKDQKQNRNGNSEKPKQNVSGRTGWFDSIRKAHLKFIPRAFTVSQSPLEVLLLF